MKNRDKCILFFYKLFGSFRVIDLLVLNTYKFIIFPIVRTHLLTSFSTLKIVEYRNSISSVKNFNAFLSDLDITLVVENDSETLPIVKKYLSIKKFLVMLDYPEIYFQKEYDLLNSFRNQNCWKLIDLSWNIRKINWNLDSIENFPDKLNMIKKRRSIVNSLKKITNTSSLRTDLIFDVEEFNSLNEFIPSDSSSKNLYYWSDFLETNKKNHIKIMASTSQFYFLNSLMPGEIISPNIENDVSPSFLNNKTALEFHELYLSKSAARLILARGQDPASQLTWSAYLEKKLGLTS